MVSDVPRCSVSCKSSTVNESRKPHRIYFLIGFDAFSLRMYGRLNLLGRKIANLVLAVGFGTSLMEIIPEMRSNNCFFLVVHGLLNQAKEQRKLQHTNLQC